ncbi:hypothetical protein B0D71_24575 [Pseudomonas laurylsulfativorans]|uniref:Uncharacterized protein n=1 Tax=Pseudomonas laurylsulfativorans TaxID=1943631 RepID=A0A2S3VHZ0_9PSED|nr:hypothetical protein B0D71_24575 [Pseudomonas laurylsulfativorans]
MKASQTRIKYSIAEKGVTIDVGASLLAMVVNDYAYCLEPLGELESIASKPAPTGVGQENGEWSVVRSRG